MICDIFQCLTEEEFLSARATPPIVQMKIFFIIALKFRFSQLTKIEEKAIAPIDLAKATTKSASKFKLFYSFNILFVCLTKFTHKSSLSSNFILITGLLGGFNA